MSVMNTVFLNSNNLDTSVPFNNTYAVTFPSIQEFGSMASAVVGLVIPYSWKNVSALYGNNTFSYIWLPGTGDQRTITVTIPDGQYTIEDINAFLQYTMVNNGHYLVDANDNNVYFLSIQTNSALYSVQLNCLPTPHTLPSFPYYYPWTAPNGRPDPAVHWTAPAASRTAAQIVIGASGSGTTTFGAIIGLPTGTYPSAVLTGSTTVDAAAFSRASLEIDPATLRPYGFRPQVSPVSAVQVLTNFTTNSKYSANSRTLYQFSPQVTFGANIVKDPPAPLYLGCIGGGFNTIRFEFVDQLSRPLQIIDTDLSLTVAFVPR